MYCLCFLYRALYSDADGMPLQETEVAIRLVFSLDDALCLLADGYTALTAEVISSTSIC